MVKYMKYFHCKNYYKQSGFSLYLVLIILVVIAFLVVATMQSTSVSTRTATNDSDYQFALQNAQMGLNAAREKMKVWPTLGTRIKFTCDCKEGLCATQAVLHKQRFDGSHIRKLVESVDCSDEETKKLIRPVWMRKPNFSETNLDPSILYNKDGHKYRYVIEYLGRDGLNSPGVYIFRVTSMGWGKNSRTTSLVEETIQANFYE